MHGEGALADPLQALELDASRTGQKPGVEERLRGREHRVAVDVVLDVLERLVAGPHRAHAAVARERRDGPFGEAAFQPDSEHRLHMPVGALHLIGADDVVQVAEIVLHRLDLGETVERPDHEERVPEPAVAVVPVPPGVRGFRDARGHRCDDRAGFLERAELERDGGAGDRILPLEREREAPGPSPPVRGGLLLELARGLLDAARKGLVRPEEKAHRHLEEERGLVEHVRDRGIGVESQRLTRVHEANVVGAVGDVGGARAVVEARAHPDADARRPTGRADPAHQHGGAERAPPRMEPRGEVGHDDAVAFTVLDPRLQNRGVRGVALFGAHRAQEIDGEEARLRVRVVVDQAAEHRVRVEAREATPHDTRVLVDERAVGAVADDSEVEGRHLPPARVEMRPTKGNPRYFGTCAFPSGRRPL